MAGTCAPESDAQRIAAAVMKCIAAASPASRDAAAAVIARLPPERWAIEWNLPLWLGRSLGVDDDLADRMAVAAVLGLGAVRLRDDLADGDIAAEETPAATALAALFWEQSLAVDRELFPEASPFWGYLEDAMTAWTGREANRSDLTVRGSPLKIPALGICLLAGRPDEFPPIATCLDFALEALALDDDMVDWRGDVAAGRSNAFVAHAAPDAPPDPDRARAAVLVAMLTTDAIATYVARIATAFEQAAAEARRLGINPLADHLAGEAGSTAQQGASLEAHYHDTARHAAELLSGTVR